jgi:uncharacterized protein YjbI with pentapeptide repeats
VANLDHLYILNKGVAAWNQWRKENPEIEVDFYGANLKGLSLSRVSFDGVNLNFADLQYADLRGAYLVGAKLWNTNLSGANLSGAYVHETSLSDANLSDANLECATLYEAKIWQTKLTKANLKYADLSGSDLQDANLSGAILTNAHLDFARLIRIDLSRANLEGATLTGAVLIDVNFEEANLANCSIYGISAWGNNVNRAIQTNLIITNEKEPIITVDNLEVAQFIYLLINNEKLRDIIDTITSKVVLILGRFTPERKPVLDAMREELRKYNYLPIMFDFEKPASQDFIEPVSTLAHLARFVIADFTDAKIILEEVPHIVRNITVPVKPLLLEGSGNEPVTLYNLRRNHHSLLDTYLYKGVDDLLLSFKDRVVEPAERKASELKA